MGHVNPEIRVDLVSLLKALAFSGFRRERPHDAHARQILLHSGGDFALLFVALHKSFFHFLAEEDGVRQDEGDRRHSDGSHRDVHREHEGNSHRHEDRDAQYGGELLRNKRADAVHVRGAALEDVAGVVLHVPGERQAGDVRKQLVAHALDEVLGCSRVEHRGAVLGDGPDDGESRDGQRHQDQVLPEVGEAAQGIHEGVDPPRELRRLPADGVIDRRTDDLRIEHVDQGHQRRAGDAQHKKKLASFEEAEQQLRIVLFILLLLLSCLVHSPFIVSKKPEVSSISGFL